MYIVHLLQFKYISYDIFHTSPKTQVTLNFQSSRNSNFRYFENHKMVKKVISKEAKPKRVDTNLKLKKSSNKIRTRAPSQKCTTCQ